MQKFTHGMNILGQHVDAIVQKDKDGYTVFIRPATPDEIKENCK